VQDGGAVRGDLKRATGDRQRAGALDDHAADALPAERGRRREPADPGSDDHHHVRAHQ